MKKKDLKTGMLIVTSNEDVAIIMLNTSNGDVFCGGYNYHRLSKTWGALDNINEDLEFIVGDKSEKIVKVFSYPIANMFGVTFSTRDRNLIWERDGENND